MANTAFIILDLQNDICNKGGIFHKNGLDVTAATTIIPNIVEMAYFCKNQNIPIIAIQLSVLENANKEAIGLGVYKKMMPFLEIEGLRNDSWGHDFIEEIKYIDYKIKRWTMSSFYQTELAKYLAALRINTLILSGFTTNGIVETTAREAASRNYKLFTLSDCTASYSKELHLTSLTNLNNFTEVITSKQLIENIQREKK
ncbi:MAG: Peroxyureidoacrylate/ureidoacrylate amidohydrolase RutB [Candidatus Anoxychlamydiales bacterium]|nr:Peroxyureidoacrylate/ureidoacrylate amidohydrolase RutB [Candidatus Anoxychlamydiales bacterium]